MNPDSTTHATRPTVESGRSRAKRSTTHDSSSFIVRFWEEPREGDGQPVLRGYIKHLKTGREQYFSNLSEVPRLLGADLET